MARKCPTDIRPCPSGWTGCDLCANYNLCLSDMYVPEPTTDVAVLVKAAEVCEQVVQAEVVESVAKCRGTWAARFNSMTETERWADYRKHHVTDLMYKEPVKCMSGPTEPGGSTMKCKKSTKGNKPTVYVWEDT